MGLIFNDISNNSSKIVFWEIKETIEELELMYLKSLEIRQIPRPYEAIKLEKRRKHWLVSRLILNELLNSKCNIDYDKHRAPFIVGLNVNISISHSDELLCIMISEHRKAGIDIQKKSEKPFKIHTKFLNNKELKLWEPEKNLDYIHAIWTIKEAVFKSFKHSLPFKDIDVRSKFPFKSDLIEVGVRRGGKYYTLVVRHHRKGDYYLSYVKL